MPALLVLGAILTLMTPSPAPAAPVAPTAQEVATAASAKVWLGRHAEFANDLRTGKIVRVIDVNQGVTRPKRAFFRPGGIASSALV